MRCRPQAKEHWLEFGAIAADAVQIALCQTFPSEPSVINGRNGSRNPFTYIMRVDDENNDIYAAAIPLPGRAEFRLTCRG